MLKKLNGQMIKLNIQHFGEAGDGNKSFVFFRRRGDTNAFKVLLQTEHENSLSRDSDATATKDGSRSSSGVLEDELSVTALRPKSFDTIKWFKIAMKKNHVYESWVVYLEDMKEADGVKEYYAEYRQGKVNEFTETNPADDKPEIEITYATDSEFTMGYTPLPLEAQQVADYIFHKINEEPAANATDEEIAAASTTLEDVYAEDAGTTTTESGSTTTDPVE